MQCAPLPTDTAGGGALFCFDGYDIHKNGVPFECPTVHGRLKTVENT
nr:MAG TPA: hypothetical protein [Caudoviricetes sp.]